MSDLPLIRESPLEKLISDIDTMKRSRSSGRFKPHKIVLLLAIVNLFERGEITENKIYFNDILVKEFESTFALIGTKDDWCQPAPPFFHLRSSRFWFHKIIPGREETYKKIKTSGGGIKRILEYIEYAYFSDYAFEVFITPQLREYLKQHLISILNPNYRRKKSIPRHIPTRQAQIEYPRSKEVFMSSRIGTMFHETFALNREAVKQVIKALSTKTRDSISDGGSVFSYLEKTTNLGSNHIKAMPHYAMGCGILNFDNTVSTFGGYTERFDPSFSQISTQWLMHYYLSSPEGPGPLFWNKVVTTFFIPGSEFTKNGLLEFLASELVSVKGLPLSDDSIRSVRSIFLGTYLKEDGLGNLEILSAVDEDNIKVNYPEPPSVWVMGAALLHYWQTCFPGQRMINLNDILDESDFARIFLVGARRVNRMLRALQEIGYVEVFTSAPPYSVALLQDDPRPLYERMYSGDEIE